MLPPKVSIIIPVYNGESFLKETIDNILAQTYKNWELICVDDSSIDTSYSILKEYEKKDARIKVFKKENEHIAAKGVKFGLNHATGDYMMYSSQDDLFSNDLLEKNIMKALDTAADYVLPQMKWYYGSDDIRDGFNVVEGDVDIVLSGREALVLSLDWKIHGFGLLKMSMVRKTGWYDYGYDSDEYTTRVLFLNSNKIVFSDGVFYYRQNNPNAITSKFSPIQFDAIETCFRIEKLLTDNCFANDEINRMRRITYNKIVFLIKQYFRHKSIIEKKEKKRIKKLLRSSFNKLDKSFFTNEESCQMINKSFNACYIYYYVAELKRSNPYFIKFLNMCKLKF